mgnify:CR=1 FL=1
MATGFVLVVKQLLLLLAIWGLEGKFEEWKFGINWADKILAL